MRSQGMFVLSVVAVAVGCASSSGSQGPSDMEACGARVAALIKVDPAPPAKGFDGNWQCMYTVGTGEDMAEYLSFVANGSKLKMVGRDNWDNNVVWEATIAGSTVVLPDKELTGFRLELDPSGRLLEGPFVWWGEHPDGMTCLESRYVCRKR